MNYEILISVSLGDNLPLQEEFLSKSCKTTAILEAKFNEEVLQSDPILIDSVNPELATELGFRLNKKDFQQFRIERKSIKLQCFVDYSTLEERHFIGYVVLQIRDIQEYTHDPKYKWHILLNPKYKGSSSKRPQLYLAFMVNKLNEEEMTGSQTGGLSLSESHHEYLENHFIRPMKKPQPIMSSSVHFPLTSSTAHEFDSNLKVKLKSRTFYVWDENKCSEGDCTQMYLIQIQIDKPRNLSNLLGEKSKKEKGAREENEETIARKRESGTTEYHFKYTILGKQIKSNNFFDIEQATDFRKHRFLFPILTYDEKMLQEYFESYPTIEIRLCARNAVVGFVTTNLLRLFENHFATIEGDYMIVPEDESVYVKEPFPVIELNMAISRMDHPSHYHSCAKTPRTPVHSKRKVEGEEEIPRSETPDRSLSSADKGSQHRKQPPSPPLAATVNHYYIAIDLRTIRLAANSCQILFQPFYLQFSYAFFGISDYIKTYPSIQFSADRPEDAITVPHGFCGFNFATTQEKLRYTFSSIPFIVQLHLEADDTLLGTAELDLSCLLQKEQQPLPSKGNQHQLGDNFVNTTVYVEDELNDQICEIQVVMFLQEMANLSYCADGKVEVNPKAIVPSSSAEGAPFPKNTELLNSLNDMIIETAHDIELWKEEQMRIFKSRLKLKEQQFLANLQSSNKSETAKQSEQQQRMQVELETGLKQLAEREKLLTEKEAEVAQRQKELDNRFHRLSTEIEDAIHDVRLQYEEKATHQRGQLKALEAEKHKCQERLYLLERKVKEKDLKIRELEGKLTVFSTGQQQQQRLNAQRATSLTRYGTNNNSNTATAPRRIIITRDSSTPPLSKSMIEQGKPPPTSTFESRIRSPSLHRNNLISKPPPPLKPAKIISANRSSGIPPSMIPDPPATATDPSPLIIEKIKKERQELLKRGVSLKDPLIVEIDKRIKNYRPVTVKRI